MYNNDFFQNTNETNISGDNNYVNNDMDVNVNMNNMSTTNTMSGGCILKKIIIIHNNTS